MLSIQWDSYSINKDEDGTQITEKWIMSWLEFNQGWGTFSNGFTRDLPQIGTIYNYYQDPFLAVTNISLEPDVGKMPDIANIFTIADNQMVRVVYTYSSDNAVRREIRADQAASWDFKWDTELIEEKINYYYDINTETYKEWNDVWKFYNPGNDAVDPGDEPDLIKKTRRAQMIFTCYSSEHFGYRFSQYLGKVNEFQFSSVATGVYTNAIQVNKEYYKAVGDYFTDLGDIEDDKYLWFFSDFEIEEIRPKVIKNTLYFDFKPDRWDRHENSVVALYELADFNDLYEGMTKTEPLETRNE